MRFFALVGFSYMISLLASIYLGCLFAFVSLCILIILIILLIVIKKLPKSKIIFISLGSSLIALVVYLISFNFFVKPIYVLDNVDATLVGHICEDPYKQNGRFNYFVQTESISKADAPQRIKIKLSTESPIDAELYDKISLNAHFYLPYESEDFSSRFHYAAIGIHMLAYSLDEDVSVEVDESKFIYYYAVSIKRFILNRINTIMPSSVSPLASGVFLGAKEDLPQDVKDDFRDTGIYHLIAVSGIHVSIIVSFLMTLFDLFNLDVKLCSILLILSIFSFMAVTGFPHSAVRAGIMAMVYYFSTVIDRPPDSLNSLGFSVFVICLSNPFAAGDIGLLLSLSATGGIVSFSSSANKYVKSRFDVGEKLKTLFNDSIFYNVLNKLCEFVVSVFTVSVIAYVCTLPILIIAFSRISLIAPISNIFVIYFMSILLMLTPFISFLSIFECLKFIYMPLMLVASVIAKYVMDVTRFLSQLPISAISVKSKFILIWIAGTLLLCGIGLFLECTYEFVKWRRQVPLLSLMILLCGILSYQMKFNNSIRVSSINTGNGVGIAVNQGDHAALISLNGDSFYSSRVINCLRNNNIRHIDCVILPKEDKNTSAYIESLCSSYKPAVLVMNKKSKFLPSDKCYEKVIEFKKEVDLDLFKDVHVKTVRNDNSIFTYLKVGDVNFLIIPSNSDIDIADSSIKCDFLIASKLPKNYDNINSLYAIIGAKEEEFKSIRERLAFSDPETNIIPTCLNDVISIDIKKRNNITIRKGI